MARLSDNQLAVAAWFFTLTSTAGLLWVWFQGSLRLSGLIREVCSVFAVVFGIELVVCLRKKKQRAAEAAASGLTTFALFSLLFD